MNSKKVEILLLEGTPYGLRYIDLKLTNIRVFISPRTSVDQLLDRVEMKKAGIYLLFNPDVDNELLPKVYIGEADVLCNRIKGHLKEDWTEIVVFTATDEGLDKADVRYIESILVERALGDKLCNLTNANQPSQKILSEADKAVMDGFIENIIFMLAVLNYKIIRTETAKQEVGSGKDAVFFCNYKESNIRASGIYNDEGFIVLKGSQARVEEVPSLGKYTKELRKKLIQEKAIAKDPSNTNAFLFNQDYVFKEPSTASSFILGRPSNGRADWKTDQGVKLKDLY